MPIKFDPAKPKSKTIESFHQSYQAFLNKALCKHESKQTKDNVQFYFDTH